MLKTMKSPKEHALDRLLVKKLTGKPLDAARWLLADPEVQALQDYANTVSIVRLNFNDHGPVHMRVVTLNAIHMAELLTDAGIPLSIEKEGVGSREDGLVAVLSAAFLHDIGMSIGREDHEKHSLMLAFPILDRMLATLYPVTAMPIRVAVRSLALEGIIGHMAHTKIHSLEAGLIPIADGCDMAKGRARIPMMLNEDPRAGDIHRYSAAAVESVTIEKGKERPIRIHVQMAQSVGFFQVEEVLLPKINISPVRPLIELVAQVREEKSRQYV
jgi:metal-dependent HD superfamily phosphatase/phosphodiesterase